MIETKLKDLDKNIRLLNQKGYAVRLHYRRGKYYLEHWLKAETGNDIINEEREEKGRLD